ncbi:MAG: phospho-sugar mutase [Clostridia bacterium]
MRDVQSIYKLWIDKVDDVELSDELKQMDSKRITDSFYKDIEFGTGGLRGEIGAGTNNLNIYTIGRITEGVARYVENMGGKRVAISYDSRIKSDLFAMTAAQVFAAHNIKVVLTNTLMPTPYLSYMVRHYNCAVGVMITASHNPKQYNGYKVYGSDGCQLTDEDADIVTNLIEIVDSFSVHKMDVSAAFSSGLIIYSHKDVKALYLQNVYDCAVRHNAENLKITYSALNGTGIQLVPAILSMIKAEVSLVRCQCVPDGNFPTCPYPNPEKKEALLKGLMQAQEENSDILIATDPDADRMGVAVNTKDGFKLLTGNEVGALMADYLLREKPYNNDKKPIIIKTIVTTKLVQSLCETYGAELIDVYTGFKYIGEQIAELEEKGEVNRFILGFEESYGYLAGSYVRDKDAVLASMLIAEIAAFYKKNNKTLCDRMDELYKQYGYVQHKLLSYKFEGSAGNAKMKDVLENLRKNLPTEIEGLKICKTTDYMQDGIGMRKSNVLKFEFENKSEFILRPSGTEPLIKAYLTAVEDEKLNEITFTKLSVFLLQLMK